MFRLLSAVSVPTSPPASLRLQPHCVASVDLLSFEPIGCSLKMFLIFLIVVVHWLSLHWNKLPVLTCLVEISPSCELCLLDGATSTHSANTTCVGPSLTSGTQR